MWLTFEKDARISSIFGIKKQTYNVLNSIFYEKSAYVICFTKFNGLGSRRWSQSEGVHFL